MATARLGVRVMTTRRAAARQPALSDGAAQERRFETLLANAADVILVLDEAGRLTYASPSVRHVLGYEPEANRGLDVFSFVHPEDAARVAQSFRDAQSEPGAHAWIPFRVRHADGSWCEVEAASNVMLDEPSIRGIVVNLRDVREQRRVESERAALLGLLSHDLRTPLAAIIGRSQLIQRRLARRATPDPRQLREDAAVIERTARRMEGMLEELVDLAALQQGAALTLVPRPLDLVTLGEQVVEERRELNHNHQIRLDAAASALVGVWDESRLERALTNLLSNATKYSIPGSTVTVQLSQDVDSAGAWAVLVVTDEGIGIPASELPRVAERFYRASNAADRTAGTGLGLLGVRRIVEQHGGQMSIASEEGRGTRVTLRLPLT